MRPNFLIIGAGKSGTTSLWSLLGQHPEVFMSWSKEPSFFSIDEHYSRGWEWYESLFQKARNEKAVGDASNSYSATGCHPHTVDRIARGLPDARIIYIARDPFRRAASDWMENQRVDNRASKLEFSAFIRTDEACLDKSLYWKQLEAYRARFPDERILPLLFEDFSANPERTLTAIFEFLGVDPTVSIDATGEARRPSGRYLIDVPWFTWARRLPGFGALQRAVPRRLVDSFRPWLQQQRQQARPEWDEETRRWFLEYVSEDSHRLLEYAGKPNDLWGF